MAEIERPFPPGTYDVLVVGSGPGGLQTAYCLARAGIGSFAVLSRDHEPGGMFQRFPVFQRLISWTKPRAPVARETREYEWYDHNSLLAETPEHRALVPEFMDRSFDLPAREEMEAGLRAFVERAGVQVRYGCTVEHASRDGEGFVLSTSDGEYRSRVVIFALGVTEPWRPELPGIELGRHYAETARPSEYDGRRVVIIGKRNSGFELAHGLLPWASEVALVSPRPVQTAVLALSAIRVRYLHPYDEYVRGGSGTYVVDGAIDRIERVGDELRVVADGTTWPGRLELPADAVIVATGFRAPLEPLADLDIATVADGRIPAQTPFWESVSAPGVYFAGNVTQGSPGMSGTGGGASSTSVNGFRYNARVLVRHLAEKEFGIAPVRPSLTRAQVVPFLLEELTRGPEVWIQKGYLARAVSFAEGAEPRDEGIVPLAHFVDERGPAAAAVTIQVDARGEVVPAVYVRRSGEVEEHLLDPHPLRRFDGAEHRAELEQRLGPLF